MTNFQIKEIKKEILEIEPHAAEALKRCQNNLQKLIELKKEVLKEFYGGCGFKYY